MLNWIKNLFVGTPAPTSEVDAKVEAVNAAPYKVPEPAATTPIPLVVETAPVSIVPVAEEPVVEAVVEAVVAKTPLTPKTAWPFPTAQPAQVVAAVKTATKASQKPKATAKPKTADVKKAAPTTASKKPAARGRKPKKV